MLASARIAPSRIAQFRTRGRIRLPGLFTSEAFAGLSRLAESDRLAFRLVTRLAGQHREFDAAAMARLPEGKLAEFHRAVVEEARHGFQYLYETYPIYYLWHENRLAAEAPLLAELFRALNGPAFLDAMRELTGDCEIGFADAQLTRFRPGHFLSVHDDSVEGGYRSAAFVISLSEAWDESWGGSLTFFGGQGRESGRYVPKANALSVFRVPQQHAVLPVAAGAARARVSITGWLRRGSDPRVAAGWNPAHVCHRREQAQL